MKEKPQGQAVINESDPNRLVIQLIGQLDIHTTPKIWNECLTAQKKTQTVNLIIDASQLTYCDGAGLALLLELEKRQTNLKKNFQINALQPKLQTLFDNILKTRALIKPTKEKELTQHQLTIDVGHFTVGVIENIKDNINFFGAICYHLWQTIRNPIIVRWQDMWSTAQDVGPHALPIIALLGFLMGLISAFQSAIPLQKFGAQIYIGSLVGISLVKELGPLMTAIILAGRTGAAFAAEIGTMKVNQEVDALTTMGLDPLKFLAMPRIIATTLMTPFLNIFLILFGLIGCGIVMHSLGFGLNIYIQQLKSIIHLKDCIGSIIKSLVFGILIASIGCMYGLKTRHGASTVGYSTTQAVVSSIIMIVFVDGIFACIFYALGM